VDSGFGGAERVFDCGGGLGYVGVPEMEFGAGMGLDRGNGRVRGCGGGGKGRYALRWESVADISRLFTCGVGEEAF